MSPQVLFRHVGIYGAWSDGTERDIWLRITNVSAYRAWNPRHNGVKRMREGTVEGFFGAINLLGPRIPAQRPYNK